MSSSSPTPSFEHWRALILHRPHATIDAIIRQLRQIGVAADVVWPDLPTAFDAIGYNIIFFDADMGHDSQFPWGRGAAPMPAVALIGSEAPGRVEWAIRRGAPMPICSSRSRGGGIYSAHAHRQPRLRAAPAVARRGRWPETRLSRREGLAAATAQIMVAQNVSATQAYKASAADGDGRARFHRGHGGTPHRPGTAAVERNDRA